MDHIHIQTKSRFVSLEHNSDLKLTVSQARSSVIVSVVTYPPSERHLPAHFFTSWF